MKMRQLEREIENKYVVRKGGKKRERQKES